MATSKTPKTPEQLATERLGVATRAVEALEKKRDKAETDLTDAVNALAAAIARRNYLALDPALPANNDDALVDAEIVADDAPVLPADCPECVQGKCRNCTHEVPDDRMPDGTIQCACEARDHDGKLA
jgi:hypothetical protein